MCLAKSLGESLINCTNQGHCKDKWTARGICKIGDFMQVSAFRSGIPNGQARLGKSQPPPGS